MSIEKEPKSAVLILLERDNRFLIGKRGLKQTYPGYWGPPSGKVEAGETQDQTILRELKEELGITHARPISCFGDFLTQDGEYHLYWWHVEIDTDQSVEISDDELSEIKWVTFDEYLEIHPRFAEHHFYIRRYFQLKYDAHTPGGKCNPHGPNHLSSIENDTTPRLKCLSCNFIHYENPKMVVGSVLTNSLGEVLLCRRAIEPSLGLWTIPAGYLENGETVMEGAAREIMEEAGVEVKLSHVFAIYSLKRISQVQVMFRGEVTKQLESFGHETLERAWFKPEDIPWEELAFPTVKWALQDGLRQNAEVPSIFPILRP